MIRNLVISALLIFPNLLQGEIKNLLSLNASLEQKVFFVGQPIQINGTLKNLYSEYIRVNTRFRFPGPELYLELTHKSGKKLFWLPVEPPQKLNSNDFVRLAPGETASFKINNIQDHLNDLLKADSYTATLKYVNRACIKDQECWIGELFSNEIEFSVVDKL